MDVLLAMASSWLYTEIDEILSHVTENDRSFLVLAWYINQWEYLI